MKKGDDFFRVTFNRSLEEIQKFEKNISECTKQSGISRPILIAAICNCFCESGMELSIAGGKIAVKAVKSYCNTATDNSMNVAACTEPDAGPVSAPEISALDSDEMLRAMGLI